MRGMSTGGEITTTSGGIVRARILSVNRARSWKEALPVNVLGCPPITRRSSDTCPGHKKSIATPRRGLLRSRRTFFPSPYYTTVFSTSLPLSACRYTHQPKPQLDQKNVNVYRKPQVLRKAQRPSIDIHWELPIVPTCDVRMLPNCIYLHLWPTKNCQVVIHKIKIQIH